MDEARPTPEQIHALEAWLRGAFPGAYVASDGDFDREVYLFRARTKDVPRVAYELEVSYLAFEDYSLPKIIGALDRQRAVEFLRADPENRLLLNRDLNLGVVRK